LSGLRAVTHHRIAAGVSLQAGAAYPAWLKKRGYAVGTAVDEGLVVGVDTHLDTHTAAVCDALGRELASLQVCADPEGYAAVLSWARDAAAGRGLRWAIEGTRHYGLGLARHLASAGEHVEEIDAGKHVGGRRKGKATRSTRSGPRVSCWLARCRQ
jgi:transposase